MMTHFDRMNTAGLQLEALLACARRSETDRNFTPKVGKYSVGLSTGTSGRRGVFVVSPQEQQNLGWRHAGQNVAARGVCR